MHDKLIQVINKTYILGTFIVIVLGFTVDDLSVPEDTGTATLQVSVISGTLQCSMDITYSTMELTSSNTAKSEIVYDTHLLFTPLSDVILCL